MNELAPWLRPYWERLFESQTADRLPHALLCAGPAGLGKRLFCERFAQALLCKAPAADGSPCGACKPCKLFAAGSHPDYIVVEPADSKVIKVDQIRELSGFMSHTSQFGGYKISLLIPAERMNVNAANSLLKTLEEPPAGCVLVLVTANPFKLPATVRSRCQLLPFHKPPAEQAAAWLAERLQSSADPLLLLGLAGGAPLLALDYADEKRLQRRQALFQDFSELANGKADPVRTAERWSKHDPAEIARWLAGWHMDMIALKMAETPPRLFNPDLQAAMRRIAQETPSQTLFQRLDAALRLNELSATTVNPQLMLEDFLCECVSGGSNIESNIEV